ncbi:GIY-YIG nuclease family protein [Fibrobacter sp. UBA2449]|uniref:GIY-YIG nuclease family protein n=1 Tax=Fibrobacter sp. UBA2449 TaxID=1946529 RepID=UPI0025C37953|nr:hypothetical protein [Fibrobacter sp. UBA2449]
MGESPAIWEEDERSHRSGVGRWALARSIVLPLTADNCCCALDCGFTRAFVVKAERHHTFFVFKKYGLRTAFRIRPLLADCLWQKREVFVCWKSISAKNLREKGELEIEGNMSSGIYKWWSSEKEVNAILRKLGASEFVDINKELEKKVFDCKEMYCIYVGQAKDLKDRLRKHIRGSVNNSTLRRSLGGILWNGDSSEELKKKINNEFIDKFYVEYKCVEEKKLDVEESEEIGKYLRILNIDGYNHRLFMQYINKPLSDLREKIRRKK